MKTPNYSTEQIESILKEKGGFYILNDTPRRSRELLLKSIEPLLQSGVMRFSGDFKGAKQYKYINPENANKNKNRERDEKLKVNALSYSTLMSSLLKNGEFRLKKDVITTPYNQKQRSLVKDMFDTGLLSKETTRSDVIYTLSNPSLINENAMEILGGISFKGIQSSLRNSYANMRNYASDEEIITILKSVVKENLGFEPEREDVVDMVFRGKINASDLVCKTINGIKFGEFKNAVTKNTYFQGGKPNPLLPFYASPMEIELNIMPGDLTGYEVNLNNVKEIPFPPTDKWIKKINSSGLSADNLLASTDVEVFSMLRKKEVQKALISKGEKGYLFRHAAIAFSTSDITPSKVSKATMNEYIRVYSAIDNAIKKNPFNNSLEISQQVLKFSNEMKKGGVFVSELTDEAAWYLSFSGGASLLTSIALDKSGLEPEPEIDRIHLEEPHDTPRRTYSN